MSTRGPDQSVDLRDFTHTVATETGVSAADLGRRPDVSVEGSLLPSARASLDAQEHEHEEPLPDFLKPLVDQYEPQVQLLQEVGCELRNGHVTFIGIDGSLYTLPDKKGIETLLTKKQEICEEKMEQGFDRLLIVPFAMSIKHLASRYAEALLEAQTTGRLCDPDGERLELTVSDGVVGDWIGLLNADRERKLVYDVKAFDKDAHGGSIKPFALSDSELLGWQVLLVEDIERQGLGNIPSFSKGKNVGGRPQTTTGTTPNQHKLLFGDGSYRYEVGLTPESYLMLALMQLKEHGKVLDTSTGTFLCGAWMPEKGFVPVVSWDGNDHQMHLSADRPDCDPTGWGVRTAVRLT